MIASARLAINFFSTLQRRDRFVNIVFSLRNFHLFRRYRYWTLTISYMNAYRCHSRANDIKSRSPRKHASLGAIMMNPKCQKDMRCPFTLVHRQVVIARDARWLLRERYNKVKNYERRSLAIPGRIKLRFAFVRPIRAFISRALRDARRQLSRITRIARTLLQAIRLNFSIRASLASKR